MNGTLSKPRKTFEKGKAATESAKRMWLYGEGDGIRILDIQELVKKSGVCRSTIQNHMPKWKEELDTILKASSKLASPNILSLPNETLEKHKEDIDFIRGRLDKAKSELTALPSIISDLRDLVSQFISDEDKYDQAITLLDRYLRMSMNEKSLTKLFIDLKNVHDQKCGIDSLKAIQEATGKAASVAALKAENPSPQNPEGIQVVANGVFKRRD